MHTALASSWCTSVTNHPYVVVALVKPGDGYTHTHLLMLLLQSILVELCIFTVFFGYSVTHAYLLLRTSTTN